MLRHALVLAGALMGAAGLGLLAAQEPGGFALLFFGGLVLLGTLYERVHYKRNQRGTPPARFTRTTERFIDDDSGKAVTVWVDPATGERLYVED